MDFRISARKFRTRNIGWQDGATTAKPTSMKTVLRPCLGKINRGISMAEGNGARNKCGEGVYGRKRHARTGLPREVVLGLIFLNLPAHWIGMGRIRLSLGCGRKISSYLYLMRLMLTYTIRLWPYITYRANLQRGCAEREQMMKLRLRLFRYVSASPKRHAEIKKTNCVNADSRWVSCTPILASRHRKVKRRTTRLQLRLRLYSGHEALDHSSFQRTNSRLLEVTTKSLLALLKTVGRKLLASSRLHSPHRVQ